MDGLGEAKTFQKITPGDTVTTIATSTYRYEERNLAYTSGGTYVMKVGDVIVGGSSGATAIIVARTIASGTDGGGDSAGVLRIKCQVGTFSSENLNVSGSSNVATIAADSKMIPEHYPFKYQHARALRVFNVTANVALAGVNGLYPDQTALIGVPVLGSDYVDLLDVNEFSTFRVVDRASGSASTVNVVGYF